MKKILMLLFCSFCFAYTFNELKKEPNSLAKDYFLYKLLLNDELKDVDLASLKSQIFRFSGVLQKEINQRYKTKEEINDTCLTYTQANINQADIKCQIKRLSNINFSKKIDNINLKKYADVLKNEKLSKLLIVLAQKDPIKYCIENGYGDILLKLVYEGNYKLNDVKIGPKTKSSMLNSPYAYKFLNSAMVNDEYKLIREKLASVKKDDAKEDLAFALGLNSLMHNYKTQARVFFLQAANTYKYKRPRDNALFFAYLASKNKKDKNKILKQLANSDDLNIYSLLAKQMTNTKLPEIITPKPNKKLDYNISDALLQVKFINSLQNASKEELIKMQEKFNTINTQGQYLAISNKLSNYKDNIYPLAFYDLLKDYPIKRQALILSIAMQESRFLPASVSVSYALGMMQFMPFVAKHTAKVDFNDNNFDELNMFKPEIAYKFANAHLNLLEKSLSHPVFIAYAYNGGLGFTKRMLNKEYMFSKKSKFKEYEPFLSMELVPYLESRLYAKKVLANYFIYLTILGDNPKISDFFENLYKEDCLIQK
ncbi:transglycosylase SLT domain-containing protein [Campylobacter canadensis]|uniref:Transglycosylase SLT domain-containing protein n=1 Tax=Campylobacter canadensis TaxID=449520 RepID=A0ABS7WQG1_9BACT|nr:transglycosylase SLT domain-containing protein [Campylobacter canadensis]MBZ7987016.1 transglycosylase SLT domain-containing protein [Campylobacter canadensis]MBZ7994630.1 transglycosylase SLT domain-containing protein [Campylobacter canadensis]MBZ7996126.1 transglycosylase SLT domain-containing protein [Campylobacter canadensis]MBZ7998052.1 transglycosylase SLT domain-containing protein [Campylobacter canadensis]MBZ8000058.1 transglycosylase SLT domain-containing protein [Campylobacter can